MGWGQGPGSGEWSREPSDDEWADAPTDIGSFLHTRLRVDGDNSAGKLYLIRLHPKYYLAGPHADVPKVISNMNNIGPKMLPCGTPMLYMGGPKLSPLGTPN